MDIQHDSHWDANNDPMEKMFVLLVAVGPHRSRRNVEEYTRYQLQEMLILMGCRMRDAVDVTSKLYDAYYAAAAKNLNRNKGQDGIHEDDNKELLPYRWSFDVLQECAYAELAKRGHYTTSTSSSTAASSASSSSQLLDFDIAKDITQRNKSFVVLLGGTSGTGKSTLASLLASRLRLTTVHCRCISIYIDNLSIYIYIYNTQTLWVSGNASGTIEVFSWHRTKQNLEQRTML
jgi:hypothetical protein